MFYYYIYSIYIFIYKYIHKYLTCTTNFEKKGEERTQKTYEDLGRWGEHNAHCKGSVPGFPPLCFISNLHTRSHAITQPFGGMGGGKHSSVCPVGRAAVAGLAALGFLLHTAGLIALTWTTLQSPK